MDKKKLLLVAVSVGAVLLIVIAIPLFFISPRHAPQSVAYAPPSFNEREFFSPAESLPPVYEPPAITQVVEPVPAEPEPRAAERIEPVRSITIPAPQTYAVPRVTDVQVRSEPARPPQARQAVAAEKAAPAKKPAPAPVPRAASRSASEAGAGAAINDYWVQTGAFRTKVRAEGVKDSLADKGITSVISNYDDTNGETWYRVRVGPYTTESEAKYWLALVQSIEGFGGSQVRQTQVLR